MIDVHGGDDHRRHVYTLHYYGAQPDETVRALTPSAAVAARAGGYGSLLPAGITDETALEIVVRRRTTQHETTLDGGE
jgi:hypothetical protein